MKKLFLVAVIGVLFITFNSCARAGDSVSPVNIDLASKVFKIEELESIAFNYAKLQENYKTGKIVDSQLEAETRLVLMSLVESGRMLHDEIVSHIDFSSAEFGLAAVEIEEFKNMDETDLAQLSFAFSSIYSEAANANKFVSCFAVATGIAEIQGLISNSSQLMTAQGTMRVAKLLIKRSWDG